MHKKVDEWIANPRAESTQKVYNCDKSGKITYTFNSLGFRGEEPRPNAKIKIYACGCSYTIGTGLSVEHIWPNVFKQKLVKEIGCKEEDVNLLNFSSGAKSNDYIARTTIRQSLAEKPDGIVCYFTHRSRSEYLKDVEVINMLISNKSQEDYFAQYYTIENGLVNMLKNIYLLKLFCESNNIPYLFGGAEINLINNKKFITNPVIAQYVDFLKGSNLCFTEMKYGDRAADEMHPGPKSAEEYATKFFKEFVEKNKDFIEKAKEKCL